VCKTDGTTVSLVQLQNPWGANPASTSSFEDASTPSPHENTAVSFASSAAEGFSTSANSCDGNSSHSHVSGRTKGRSKSRIVEGMSSSSDWAKGSPNWTPEMRTAVRNALRGGDRMNTNSCNNRSSSCIGREDIDEDGNYKDNSDDDDDNDKNRGRFWLSWDEVVGSSVEEEG